MQQNGSAQLSAPSRLTASASVQPGLGSLWQQYLTASQEHARLLRNWSIMAPALRTDGTAGAAWAKVYAAEQAKEAAHKAWAALYQVTYPAPPSGQPGPF